MKDKIYNEICRKEEKENEIMDNAIIDNYVDCFGIEQTNVIFEDEIKDEQGDWYCTASGGGFTSSADYWNYILG